MFNIPAEHVTAEVNTIRFAYRYARSPQETAGGPSDDPMAFGIGGSAIKLVKR